MTQIVFEHTRTGPRGTIPQARFQLSHGESATESALPAKPSLTDECCPHCRQALVLRERNAFQRLRGALFQLLSAVALILISVLRLARLGVAMVMSLIGVIGFGLQNVAMRIAHPDDRRLLPGGKFGQSHLQE